MALPNELHPLQLGAGSVSSYQIEQSLRFDGSSYLSWSSSGNGSRKKWTLSVWVKRSDLNDSNDHYFWSVYENANNRHALGFLSSGQKLQFEEVGGGSVQERGKTPAQYRDPSAWMHIVEVYDVDNATAADRGRIYVNGQRVENLTDTVTNSGWAGVVGSSSYPYVFGRRELATPGSYFNGYLAEAHLVNNQALDPDSFGEYDNGVWRPIEYTGSHGTTGFYLKFDPTATNGVGHDHSGNGNHFTASGFTTSGTGTDVMSDTPTKNFCTWNAVAKGPGGTYPYQVLSNGNLQHQYKRSGMGDWFAEASFALAGTNNYYWEVEVVAASTLFCLIGICEQDWTWNSSPTVRYQSNNGVISNHVSDPSNNASYTGATYGNGDVIGCVWNGGNQTLQFYKNGVSQGSPLSPTVTTGKTFVPCWHAASDDWEVVLNCGQREFAYPPGTSSATNYFNTVTYTGNGSTQSITGVGFQPDFVWIKKRDSTGNHMLTDVVTGANKELNSNTTSAQADNTNALTSFDSDGFSVGSDGAVNINNESLVAWCWKAGGTAVSNTDGTITSSVSANQDAGFSVVSYVANGTSTQGSTVGHGLGVAPKFMIVKDRDATQNWFGYFEAHPGAAGGYNFNLTQAAHTSDAGYWDSTAPTSTVFTIGNYHGYTGEHNMIAYCWTEKAGVSKFGTYTGNGSSTGPFIECGFKPRLVIVKRTDAASNWFMYDTIRGTNNKLYADNVAAENGEDGGSTSSNTILSLSTGFQMTSSNGSNASGGTYIFMAWAENFSADDSYKDLNSANLPAPTIKDGSDYFQTVLYTGTDASHAITVADNSGNAWGPDLVWIKPRSVADNHRINDKVRGVNKTLSSNSTTSEYGPANAYLDSFDSGGFTISGSDAGWNSSSHTYVAWNWLEGVSQGFDIVSYTGDDVNGRSIAHSLGVTPAFIIVKARNATEAWAIWHQDLGGATKYLTFTTAAVATASAIFGGGANEQLPDSTNFYVGSNGMVNDTGVNYIAYCFAEVENYSRFGKYTGNGSADGPFVYCGFKPAFLIIKRFDTTGGWNLIDAKRPGYNVMDVRIEADNTAAEDSHSNYHIDLLSNGFKLRGIGGERNGSGNTFIYAAFAEHPFGGDGVSPGTAR